MAFEALLEELETLQKAMDEEDQKIQAAAEGDEDEDDEKEPDGDEEGEDTDDDGDGEDEMMGKSFEFELESGQRVKAFDGTELLKSLAAQVKESETERKEIAAALESAVMLIKSQSEAISDLRASVAKLANQGRGRKSVLTVAEPPVIAKSETADEMQPGEILAKCREAHRSGKLGALDVSRAEIALNNGVPVDPRIIAQLA